MEELRATNLSLSDRLDSLHRSLSLSPAHGINQVSLSLSPRRFFFKSNHNIPQYLEKTDFVTVIPENVAFVPIKRKDGFKQICLMAGKSREGLISLENGY